MNVPKVKEPRRRIVSVMNFQSEAARLETFKDWPSKNVTKEDLAKSGFVFSKKKDQVKCFFCKGSIVYWDAGDSVTQEHKKSYPQCPLANGNTAINIPLGSKQYERLNQYLQDQLDSADPPKRRNSYEADAKKADREANPLCFAAYKNLEKRLSSFDAAPPCMPPAKRLADAGLFYSTFADLAQCYCCGGGIINWSPDENPEEVHDRLYPNCPLAVRSAKTADSKLSLPQTNQKRRLQAEDLEDDILNFPWVQTLRKAHSDKMIKKALVEDLAVHLSLPYNINQATEVISDYEERLE